MAKGMPTSQRAVLTAMLLGVSLTEAPAVLAAGPDGEAPDAEERAFTRQLARDERASIREHVRGWTWAALPPIDDRERRDPEGLPVFPLVGITALAATALGHAMVGGVVRGPARLGATRIVDAVEKHGFIARVDRAGDFQMIRLGTVDVPRTPTALAVDRTGRIVASYAERRLVTMTRAGRELWSTDLPAAHALAFTPDGDILASGCNIDVRRESSPYAKVRFDATYISEGYVARVSSSGKVRWLYRLGSGREDLFYRPNDRSVTDCATGIVPTTDGGAIVAGYFERDLHAGQVDDPNLPRFGSFLARFSMDGQLRWSRLVAPGYDSVSLAAGPGGAPLVVAGQVVPRSDPKGGIGQGLAAFDPEGVPLWTLPIGPVTPPKVIEARRDALRIVARPTAAADFACAGTYRAPITVGRALFGEADGGVFLAEIDRRGNVTELRGVPGKRRPKGAGHEVTDAILAPAASALWVGGTMTYETEGAWLQVAPW